MVNTMAASQRDEPMRDAELTEAERQIDVQFQVGRAGAWAGGRAGGQMGHLPRARSAGSALIVTRNCSGG